MLACPYMASSNPQQRQRRQLQRQGGGEGGPRPGNGRGGGNRFFQNGTVLSVDEAVPLPATIPMNQALALAKQDIVSMLNGNRAAEFVRLAFHDCVGGACDGCVDMSNVDNLGLESPIDHLEGLVIKYNATGLSRADLWVWAGLVSAEVTQRGRGGRGRRDDSDGAPHFVPFTMQYVGRPSCPTPKGGPSHQLPSPHMTSNHLVEFFEEQFQFSPRETAAIMGAHTLYVGTVVRFCSVPSPVAPSPNFVLIRTEAKLMQKTQVLTAARGGMLPDSPFVLSPPYLICQLCIFTGSATRIVLIMHSTASCFRTTEKAIATTSSTAQPTIWSCNGTTIVLSSTIDSFGVVNVVGVMHLC